MELAITIKNIQEDNFPEHIKGSYIPLLKWIMNPLWMERPTIWTLDDEMYDPKQSTNFEE